MGWLDSIGLLGKFPCGSGSFDKSDQVGSSMTRDGWISLGYQVGSPVTRDGLTGPRV